MKSKILTFVLVLTILSLVLAACQPKAAEPVTLTVMTHDSFSASEDVIAAFEKENNVKLVFVKSGDAGSALNHAILTKDSPQADVFYGVDNTFLSRAIKEGIFESYASPLLANIPDEFKLAANNEVSPVDYGDVCINYDKAYFASKNLPIPQSLEDLTNPIYGKSNGKEGLLVIENPASSSTGLAFLLATIAQYGPDKYLDYWQRLKDNGLVIVNDWETAYYTNFSGSSGKGAQPMVLSYATSPAAEVFYASSPVFDAPTRSLLGDNMCFRQIEFVGILKGTQQRTLAEKFVDFMLSKQFQEDMPLQMFVYPVNSEARIPSIFLEYSLFPEHPAVLAPEVISANRDKWLADWTEAILR